MGLIVQINCGGSASGAWDDDNPYLVLGDPWTDGATIDTSLLTVVPPNDVLTAYIYKSDLVTPVEYAFSALNNVPHTVRMFFFSDGAGATSQDITINGTLVEDNLNVLSQAGAADKAIQKEYAVTPTAGTINIQILNVQSGGYSQTSAIQIIQDDAAGVFGFTRNDLRPAIFSPGLAR